jgi:hypothetical protein
MAQRSQVTANPIPLSQTVKFVYEVTYKASGGQPLSSNTTFFQFCGNSLFNPDLNSTFETYPIGVPQYSNLYARYMVLGCKMDVVAQAAGTDSTGSKFIIYPHAYTTQLPALAADVDLFAGQPLASTPVVVGPSAGQSIVKLTSSKTTQTMLQRPRSQILRAQDTSGYLILGGSYSPNSQWFFTLVCSSMATGALPEAYLRIRLTFVAELYQVRSMAVSFHDTRLAHVSDDPEPEFCDCEEAKSQGVPSRVPSPPSFGVAALPVPETDARLCGCSAVVCAKTSEVGAVRVGNH